MAAAAAAASHTPRIVADMGGSVLADGSGCENSRVAVVNTFESEVCALVKDAGGSHPRAADGGRQRVPVALLERFWSAAASEHGLCGG